VVSSSPRRAHSFWSRWRSSPDFHATSAGQSNGFLWMLWEPRKRTWHGIVADSLVVRAGVYPPGEFGRRPAP
jgi:uncharacterized RDD family membrane protein YckC